MIMDIQAHFTLQRYGWPVTKKRPSNRSTV